MIVGRDLMTSLGINILFQDQIVTWGNGVAAMKASDCTVKTSFSIEDTTRIKSKADRIKNILDAKYLKADLEEIDKQAAYLPDDDRRKLLELLKNHKGLFDDTLGKWASPNYKVQLKEGAEPFHSRPYGILRVYEQMLKNEVKILVKIGVLKKINRSAWAAPTFIILYLQFPRTE